MSTFIVRCKQHGCESAPTLEGIGTGSRPLSPTCQRLPTPERRCSRCGQPWHATSDALCVRCQPPQPEKGRT